MYIRATHVLFFATLALVASMAAAHGVISWIKGANGVNMPGLGIVPDTPRDCAGNNCGAMDDTGIIRGADFKVVGDENVAKGGSPLGRKQGGGQVAAANAIHHFMGRNP
ncbi:MAG: hypothetical protein JOS17DRAFT_754116 [Linnemannia elongata]|nr:MAG: hypothetical protein JOS17DRAFT_754116 [Linnemannia elongata]